MSSYARHAGLALACLLSMVAGGCGLARGDLAAGDMPHAAGLPDGPATQTQVLRGRTLVLTHDCAGCHGGSANPAAAGWLAGRGGEGDAEMIGPFPAYARNITPDDETGIGRYSERQIFNALRWGLRPRTTPDVAISSPVPGEGNHPLHGDYLSPGMPWAYWRFMPDEDLWAITAYLKHGLRPVANRVPDSGAPPDLWAEASSVAKIGTRDVPAFPTHNEQLSDPTRHHEVLEGRTLVVRYACAGCHGGAIHPDEDGWLTGTWSGQQGGGEFQIGPFKTYPRNLTPDNATGLGRFSERQLFNALRYGLRPGDTPDVAITSTTPGQGNHPLHPKYMAPPMPWPAWRYMTDAQLHAIVVYLKYGLKPVHNRVKDSEGPPDFWASSYAPEKIGPLPPPPFPTANEISIDPTMR